MVSSQTGMEQQNLLSEPFFQEIMNDLEEPVNEKTLLNQERRYKALKNDIYVFYHEGKQNLLRQIREMSRLLEDRRSFRQLVIDNARKDPKKVEHERNLMKLILDEIDDINQQIDLEYEKHVVLDEELGLQRRQIWEMEKGVGAVDQYEDDLRREGEVLEKRLGTVRFIILQGKQLQRMYNEKLGYIINHRGVILGLEQEHKEYMDQVRVLEKYLQAVRNDIVNTLKAVKPVLKKRFEFMTRTINTRNKADKQTEAELEEMENARRKMDYDANLNKHIFEKKKPRQEENQNLRRKRNDDSEKLWDPILHVNADEKA